ncbi:hypothetical protein FOC1_g10007940 [Fusarium oxysporum f. sp. cubense race 1]|uniref:Methyltransferase n=1 Tax=Fusarium oxysporum f. sp. cubense (strain race 1) TaxID=1229664 RepID=N4U1F0_FUSC1|nr:hypothetical protein FOC1_g10007940 [Fusarium oxysporum f. sp. cubense race 1]
MLSPARKKRADSGSAGSTPPRVDPTESGLLPPEHWSQLPEEENTAEDGDSAVLDNASSTASLTSSILQYRTINGRAYQSERGNPEYWGPIDDTGQEAMDINHHVLTLLLGDKLHLAPVPDDIQTAVDIETGTGIWAMEFADKFPNASVIGTDLAPIQPGWIPPNLELRLHSTVDFPTTSRAMSHHHASRATMVQFCQAREGMREAGFVNIEERDFKNHVGGWPKDPKQRSVGQYMQAAFEQDAKGTVLHMATALGWTEEEVTVFISHFRHEIRSPKIHSYFRQKVVWGRKPL